MKKLVIASVMTLAAGVASAADFASLEVDSVRDVVTKGHSNAQYLRAGKDVAGLELGLTARTQTWATGGMANSMEATVGKQVSFVNVFGGAGYDNGMNGAHGKDFQYGLVGVSTGLKLGPVYGFTGAKTRLNFETHTPKQTLVFTGVSYPLTKTFSAEVSASRSYQDIKENAVGVALRVNY